jgi:uncharacterized protein HemY
MRALILLSSCVVIYALIGCKRGEQPLPQSTVLLVQAQEALAAGDDQAALAALGNSIASQPTVWAHLERAKLRLKMGDEPGATADCDAALALSPGNPEVSWLKGELAKPADKRFQGQFKDPPSSRK